MTKLIFSTSLVSTFKRLNSMKSWTVLIFIVALIYTFFMSRHTISLHNQFMQLTDFAAYDQIIWSLSHHLSYDGSICASIMNLWRTIDASSLEAVPDLIKAYSVLGIHFIPSIFITNAIPNLIYDSPYTTYVVQTIAFSSTAILLFFILARQGISLPVACALAFSFLVHPANLGANVNAFHPVIMALPLLMALYLAIITNRMKTYYALFFITGFIQENVWITLAALSVVFAFRKKWSHAAINFILAIVLLIATTQIFIPFFNLDHICPYCNIYGSPLGSSMGEIIKNGILMPLKTLELITRPEVLYWLHQLLSPTIYLTILSPVSLLIAIIGIAPNILSTNQAMHLMWGQYNALAMPFIYIGAGLGFHFLQMRFRLFAHGWLWAILIILVSINSSNKWAYSDTTNIDHIFTTSYATFSNPELVKSYNLVMSKIPVDASVSATEYFLNSLSRRQNTYFFPVGFQNTDFVVIEKQTLTVAPSKLNPRIEDLVSSKKYDLIVDDNFIQLWKKRATPSS